MKGALDFKAFTAWIEDFANAGQSVDGAVTEVLTEVEPFIQEELVDSLKRTSEQWTGETASTIQTNGVEQTGNYIHITATAGGGTKNEAVIAKEFGNSRQAAEPFFRPTFRGHRLKNKLKEAMKNTSRKYGLKV